MYVHYKNKIVFNVCFLGVSITETVDCEGTGEPIAGRDETDPSSGYEFEFLYSTKATPYFNSLDVVQGYIDTDLTITGEGKISTTHLTDHQLDVRCCLSMMYERTMSS